MSEIPLQTRTVDPYASYNSNVVNKITTLITQGFDVILSPQALELTIDSTSPEDHVILGTGKCVKDDVIISVDDSYRIDMTDPDNYESGTNPFNEEGYYYICLDYVYKKTKPPPTAAVRILKPSQRDNISKVSYMLIGVVNVKFVGPSFEIESILDYDPENPENQRPYPPVPANVVAQLPTFDPEIHTGKIVYDLETEDLYWGSQTRWTSFKTTGEIILAPDDSSSSFLIDKVSGSLVVTKDGDNYTLHLDNDQADPGSSYVYGTDETGSKAWLPSTAVGGFENKKVTGDYTAESNQILLIGDSTSSMTITLPASPSNGDRIEIIDAERNFDDYPVTLAGNGNTISGLGSYTLETEKARYILTFYSELNDWLVTKTTEVLILKSLKDKVLPYQMSLDDTDVGSDGGSIFGIMESVDFSPSEDGAIWFTFKLETQDIDLDLPINMEILYTLNGEDDGKDVQLETSYWAIEPGEIYSEDTPDSTANVDTIISDSTANIGILALDSLTVFVDDMYLTNNIQEVIIKMKRDVSDDTYSGTFQLAAVRLYQMS